MTDRLSPANLTGKHLIDLGRVSPQTGEPMLQRVSHCQSVPQVIVHRSRPA